MAAKYIQHPSGGETPEVVKVFFGVERGGIYGGVDGLQRFIEDGGIRPRARSRINPEIAGMVGEMMFGEKGTGKPNAIDDLCCDVAADILRTHGRAEFMKPQFKEIDLIDYVDEHRQSLRANGSLLTRGLLDEWDRARELMRDHGIGTIEREELFKTHCIPLKYSEEDFTSGDHYGAYFELDVPTTDIIPVHWARAVAPGEIHLDYAKRLVLTGPREKTQEQKIVHMLEQHDLDRIKVESK